MAWIWSADGALLVRALARILDAERGGDHQHLGQTLLLGGGEQDAPDARVDRQTRKPTAQLGQLAAGIERGQLLEGALAVGDQTRVGRIEEGEVGHVAEAEQLHAQDHGGEVGALDLGLGEGRAGGEVVLAVEPDADPGGDPPAASLALIGRGARDALDRQALELAAVAVAADPREAGVDDVMDAGNGQRGLGDVGRQHHAPSAVRLKDPRLLLRPLAGVERKDLGRGRMMLAQGLGGLADLALAGEKDQHVAAADARQLADRVRNRLLHRLVALADRFVLGRAIADLDRIGPARDFEDRRRAALCIGEVHGEALRIDGRGGNDELEIRSARQQTLQIAEQDIDIEAALVGLVDDQGVVLVEQPILLDLGEQDAVGHQLDRGLRAHPVVEAHLVPDQPAGGPAELLRDPIRQGARGDAPRLGVTDPPGEPASELQTELGQLGRLARAGLAA